MNTTNDVSVMKSLGVNPGLADNYSDLSMKPVSFRLESNLGWGEEWRAVHSATWDLGNKQVEVDGHAISMQGHNPTGKEMLNNWEARYGAKRELAQDVAPPAPGSDPPRTREKSDRDRLPSY